jgi:hypothetical protein
MGPVLLCFSRVPGFVYQQQSIVFTREVKLPLLAAVFRHVRVVDLVYILSSLIQKLGVNHSHT